LENRQRREHTRHISRWHEWQRDGVTAATTGGDMETRTAYRTAYAAGESNLPMTVKDAARFLGVSPQTVYLWVERKQIPHLRVMGRNIRFLKSDLEPFRATFKHEVGYGTTDKA
jgi:excisionase family DNA binding protein